MKKLHQVLAGKYLHLPPGLGTHDRVWLMPGGVVDLADPFIAECVKGQEYKLVAVDEGEASPMVHPLLIKLRAGWDAERKTGPTPEEIAEREAAIEGIPKPDARPKREPKPQEVKA